MPTIVSMTILMAIVCLFAKISDKKAVKVQTEYGTVYKEHLFVWLIIIALSIYSAMRTQGNDTYAYINRFLSSSSTPTIPEFFAKGFWSTEKGPIFSLLRCICKHYIADNYHIFFLVGALITNGSIVYFLRRYSPDLTLPIYLYITMSGFNCSLTGMRQAMATAVVIWCIPLAMKKKWIKFAIVLWASFRIHFISILYIIVPFLLNEVWNKIAVIAVIAAVVAGFFFTQFSELMLDVSESLGFDEYDSSILYGKRINIARLLVYCVPPALSLYKKKKFTDESPVIKCLANLSIVAAGFIFLGIFGKANTFGRFGLLFEPSLYITLPTVVRSFDNDRNKKITFAAMVVCFFIYYVFAHMKHGLSVDYFNMESIFNWFK